MGQLEKVITVQPTNAQSFEGVLKIRAYQKNWVEALALAERVKGRFPNTLTGYYFARLVYQAKKRVPENIRQFESTLAVSPDAVQLLTK
jgi:hypothetical protein